MSAHTIYLFCLVVGLAFTLLSGLLGHFFGAMRGTWAAAAAMPKPAPTAAICPGFRFSFHHRWRPYHRLWRLRIIFTELAGHPAGDYQRSFVYRGRPHHSRRPLQILSAIFSHTQGSSESHVAALVGTEASVITPIPEHGVGESPTWSAAVATPPRAYGQWLGHWRRPVGKNQTRRRHAVLR